MKTMAYNYNILTLIFFLPIILFYTVYNLGVINNTYIIYLICAHFCSISMYLFVFFDFMNKRLFIALGMLTIAIEPLVRFFLSEIFLEPITEHFVGFVLSPKSFIGILFFRLLYFILCITLIKIVGNKYRYRYMVLLPCIIILSYIVSCLIIPCFLKEPITSNKITTIDKYCNRIYVSENNPINNNYLLIKIESPQEIYIFKNSSLQQHKINFKKSEQILDIYRRNNGNNYCISSYETIEDNYGKLKFSFFNDSEYVKHSSLECKGFILPPVQSNCFSPDGNHVALNNYKTIEILPNLTNDDDLSKISEMESLFLKWLDSNRALYFCANDSKLLTKYLDRNDVETLCILPTLDEGINPFSISISPNENSVVYSNNNGSVFYIKKNDSKNTSHIKIDNAKAFFPVIFPNWVNEEEFIYISHSMKLYSVNCRTKDISLISQAFEVVHYAKYFNGCSSLFWLTSYGKRIGFHKL